MRSRDGSRNAAVVMSIDVSAACPMSNIRETEPACGGGSEGNGATHRRTDEEKRRRQTEKIDCLMPTCQPQRAACSADCSADADAEAAGIGLVGSGAHGVGTGDAPMIKVVGNEDLHEAQLTPDPLLNLRRKGIYKDRQKAGRTGTNNRSCNRIEVVF
jgi:hypothetical protein